MVIFSVQHWENKYISSSSSLTCYMNYLNYGLKESIDVNQLLIIKLIKTILETNK